MRRLSDLDGQVQRCVNECGLNDLQGLCSINAMALGIGVSGNPAEKKPLQIFPSGRSSRTAGPGIEIRDDPVERTRREQDMDDMTSLE